MLVALSIKNPHDFMSSEGLRMRPKIRVESPSLYSHIIWWAASASPKLSVPPFRSQSRKVTAARVQVTAPTLVMSDGAPGGTHGVAGALGRIERLRARRQHLRV